MNLFLQLIKFVIPCSFFEYVIKWHHRYYKVIIVKVHLPERWLSAKVFPYAINSALHFFMSSVIKVMFLLNILYILKQSIIQTSGAVSEAVFVVYPHLVLFVHLV